MKVIFYIILIVEAFEIQGETDPCLYKETCTTEDGVFNFAYCFKIIPKEDQRMILKKVEDRYRLEETPIDDFLQTTCDYARLSDVIFYYLVDQIYDAYKNSPVSNMMNEKNYVRALIFRSMPVWRPSLLDIFFHIIKRIALAQYGNFVYLKRDRASIKDWSKNNAAFIIKYIEM